MAKFYQITKYDMSMLNNSEYQNFMERFLALIPEEESGDRPVIESPSATGVSAFDGDITDATGTSGASPVNISSETIASMEALLEKMTDLNRKSRALETTAARAETDRLRDAVANRIINQILKTDALLLDTEREASDALRITITPYKGVGRLPMNQETTVLKGMLYDLRKTENADAVAALSLTSYLDELERLNTLFESLVSQESATRSASSLNEDSKALRVKLDELYAECIMLANATQVLAPTETSETFIRDVNSLIDEVRIAYNRRRSPSSGTTDTGTGEGGSSSEDRPEIE